MSNRQPDTEKTPRLKVLVLDDDRLSSHNLSIQLRFVGEVPLVSTSENWQQMFGMLSERGDSTSILALVLGQIRKTDLTDLLLNLHHHSPELPILSLAELSPDQMLHLPDTLQARLLPLGEGSLNYQRLMDALNTARRLTGRQGAQPQSRLISATGTAMFRSLSGQSPHMQRIRHLLQQVAARPATVLVTGESGSGKEIVARNIHYHSGRGDRPFIAVNSATLVPDRHGSELFGLEKGYNGARGGQEGLFERADGGTLFLDEIGDMPLPLQALLLRFLEDRQFQRVGGHELLSTDVRVVAATKQNLEQKIAAGEFREDLYYRLSVVPIVLPPLRQRLEDIPELIRELISSLENRDQTSIRFNSQALLSLQAHHWPGNVRELANLVERLGIMQPNAVIGISDLPPEYQYPVPDPDAAENFVVQDPGVATANGSPLVVLSQSVPLADTGTAMLPLNEERLQQYLENFEKQLLAVALDDSAGSVEFAAERLKMDPARLRERMQQLEFAGPAQQ